MSGYPSIHGVASFAALLAVCGPGMPEGNALAPGAMTMDSSLPPDSARHPAEGHPPAHEIFTAEDRQLLQNCLDGLPAAWDSFVARFGGLLAYVVDRTAAQRRISLTAADRDDLLADILLEILHHDAAVLRGFAGRSSLATYLAVVARRVAVRCLGRLAEKTHGRRPLAAGNEPSQGDDGQARFADREHVERMLVGLEANEAQLVRLHHLEARSYGEISRLTGMPLNSIGPTLARARQKMKLQSS